MKISFVTDAFAVWGGMERVLADKMNALAGQYGWDVTLITTNQGEHPLTYELHPNVRHIDLGVRMHQEYRFRGFRKLLKRRELKQILKNRVKRTVENLKPDVVVCVKLDFVPVLADLKGDLPLVVESHTLCHSEKMDEVGILRRLYIWSLKRSIRKADAVVALTEGDANDWKTYNDNVYVIPNVVNLNDQGDRSLIPFQGKDIKRPVPLIYVGRFSKQKDIDSLLRIWEIVHQKHPDWRLDIYGEGELKEHYLTIIQSMNANIHVYNPTADIMEVYREHSILLLTSLYEPFGLVLPEAMSCGLPVVAFDCPYGPADIITDEVDGYLIADRNIDLFAQRVGQLISDYDLRVKMGKAGIASSKRYLASRIMPQWIQLFEQLTSSRGK
jgi:glycosyltransferase involved in cell wall biosynthesis